MPESIFAAIHPGVREREGELTLEFAQAEPFRHVVIDNFLDPGLCERLMAEFPPFEPAAAVNERGEPGRKCARPDILRLGASFRRFDALMRDPDFLSLAGRITGIADLLYDPEYVGGGTHENVEGADMDVHIDFNYHPRTRQHRRLNLIVFLNREWEESWGGCLELHRDAWNPERDSTRRIVPVANRAVLFETTEQSWHGFTRIAFPAGRQNLSRRSLAVYFYSKERPTAETASRHATVYVPPPLPAHLRPGHTLSDDDLETLQTLVTRRDTQLRFLYDRERKFAGLIDGLTDSPSFRVGRILTAPARWLRALGHAPEK
jgi:hypothetical protein